jgi:gliding motility-associated-like protein
LNNFPGYTFQWNFGDGRSTRAFDTVLVYNTPGRYITTLTILTPAGCRETFRDTLSINGIPTARIGLDYDPCSLGPVRFRNISLPSAQGNITQIQWNFGDGSTGTSPIELHQYPDTAVYAVQLLVSDENNCQDDTVIVFPWLPKPVYPVALANSRGCVPLLAQAVQPNPYPIQGYQTLWTYGDGSQSTQGQASEYVYNNAGIYTRKLVVVSPSGCVDSFQSRHEALAVPIANFNYSPNPVNSLDPLVQFTDLSVDAVNWEWNFGLNRNEGRDYRPSPEHRYRDTGRFTVQLVVQHQSGCRDTLNKDLDIVPKFTYFLPNAFTPNGDGKNDVYMGRGVLDYVEDFSMQIYNRWGERIFETKNPNEAWNGRKNNTGEMCQAGVYVVVVRIKGPRGADQEIKGFATLVN